MMYSKARIKRRKEAVQKQADEARERFSGDRLFLIPIEEFGDDGIILVLIMELEEAKRKLSTQKRLRRILE